MKNSKALIILRLAYDEISTFDLSNEELEQYKNIGIGITNEANRESVKREKELSQKEGKL